MKYLSTTALILVGTLGLTADTTAATCLVAKEDCMNAAKKAAEDKSARENCVEVCEGAVKQCQGLVGHEELVKEQLQACGGTVQWSKEKKKLPEGLSAPQ